MLSLLVLGIPLLFAKWYDSLRKKFFYSKCIAADATHVWVQGPQKDIYDLVPITLIEMPRPNGETFNAIKIIYRYLPYAFDPEEFSISPIRFTYGLTCAKFIDSHNKCFETMNEVKNQRKIYGKCQIEVPMKSVLRIFIDELLNPFYMFQVFSTILWYWDGYIYYASVILGITVFSLSFELYETKKNLTCIRKIS